MTSEEGFDFLLDLLERAHTSGEGAQIPSHFWRASIEESAQNHRDDVGAAIVASIRDAAHAVVTEDPASLPAILDRLATGERQVSIKRRLALNLLRTSSIADVPRIATALLDREFLLDLDVHHEYRTLLRDRFGVLTPESQDQLLTLFESAPYVEQLKAEQADKGEPLSPEKEQEYRERSVREMFSLVEPHLTVERLTRYRAIVDQYGLSPHPEYLSYSESSFGFVGSRSPRSAEELRSLPVPELRAFLDTWLPAGDPFHGASRDGLASALTELVGSAPAQYGTDLDDLRCAEPTYVRGILEGFTNAAKSGTAIPWAPLLTYCSWVVAQPGEASGAASETWGRDPGWGWARRAILDLLEVGFKEDAGRIPIELRDAAWAALEPLTRDASSPTPESEATSSDTVTTAINSLRGRALERMIEYAFWVRKASGDSANFEQMPEVRQALESRLDPQVEPSAAIRAVYGLQLVRLFVLDRAWLVSATGRLFPADPALAELRRAAWNAYLSFSRPYDDVFVAITDVYESAIGRLEAQDTSDATTWPKLGEQLAILYWRGKITLEPTSLLRRFFSAAPDEVRAHVIDIIGRAIKDQEQRLPEAVRSRLEALWMERLDAIRKGVIQADGELRAFTWWFASKAFTPIWAAQRVIEGAELRGGGLPADHWLLESLGDLAPEIPLEALRVLRAMTLGEVDPLHFSFESIRVRQIIVAGRAAPSEEKEGLTREVLGRIAAKGCTDFLDLSLDHPT